MIPNKALTSSQFILNKFSLCLYSNFKEGEEMSMKREPRHEKTCLSYANNKGTDQLAHPRSLVSTSVVRCLDSIIPLVSITEI